MYYRVATQAGDGATWKWKSTVLSSLETLFRFLRLYQALPQDQLRVFSSHSREELGEQLVRENEGLRSTSVTATQFLQERRLSSREVAWGASDRQDQGTGGNQKREAIVVTTKSLLNEQGGEAHLLHERNMRSLDTRRSELEQGAGGDHDLPYTFTLPSSLPQVLAWMRLLVRVQQGELQL